MGSICLHSAAIPEDFNNTMFREDEHSHAKSDIPSQEPHGHPVTNVVEFTKRSRDNTGISAKCFFSH